MIECLMESSMLMGPGMCCETLGEAIRKVVSLICSCECLGCKRTQFSHSVRFASGRSRDPQTLIRAVVKYNSPAYAAVDG